MKNHCTGVEDIEILFWPNALVKYPDLATGDKNGLGAQKKGGG